MSNPNIVYDYPKPKTHLKFFSILLLAGLIVGLFYPVYFTLSGSTIKTVSGSILGGTDSIFTVFMNSVDFANFKVQMLIDNWMLVGIVGVTALTLILTLFALMSKNMASVWFRAICAFNMVLLLVYGGTYFNADAIQADIVMLVGAVATVFMILQALAGGKKAFAPILSFLVMLAAYAYCIYQGFFADCSDYVASVVETFKVGEINGLTLCYFAYVMLSVNILFTAFQMGFVKTNAFTILRYLAGAGLAVAGFVMVYLSDGVLYYHLIGLAACTVAALLFSLIAVLSRKGKKSKKAKRKGNAARRMQYAAMDAVANQHATNVYIQTRPAAPASVMPNIYINVADADTKVETYTEVNGKKKDLQVNAEQPVQPIVIPPYQPTYQQIASSTDPMQPIIIDLNNYPVSDLSKK